MASKFEKGIRMLTAGSLFLASCKQIEAKVPRPEIDEELNKPVATETTEVKEVTPEVVEEPAPTQAVIVDQNGDEIKVDETGDFGGEYSEEMKAVIKIVLVKAGDFEKELIKAGIFAEGAVGMNFAKVVVVPNEELGTADWFFEMQEGSGYEDQLIVPSLVEGETGLFFDVSKGTGGWEFERTSADKGRLYALDENGDVVSYIDYVPGRMVGNDWVGQPEVMMDGGVSQEWSDEHDGWVTFNENGEAIGVWSENEDQVFAWQSLVKEVEEENVAQEVPEDLRTELGGEYWEVLEPVQHSDGTWLLYRQHLVVNRKELVRVFDKETGEWKDYIKRLVSPNGRVFWDVHASWYEHVGKPDAITEWDWNPNIPEASARWEEAAYRALWSLAAYAEDGGNRLNPGITYEQIVEGAEFYYENNRHEIVRVDTSKPVRFVWDLNAQDWLGHKLSGAIREKYWEEVDGERAVTFYLGQGVLDSPFSTLADKRYWYTLRGISIPEVMAGRIDPENYYNFYISDNPNSENYDMIETLLYGKVFRGRKPDGVPDDVPKNADFSKELLQVERGEGFVSPYD